MSHHPLGPVSAMHKVSAMCQEISEIGECLKDHQSFQDSRYYHFSYTFMLSAVSDITKTDLVDLSQAHFTWIIVQFPHPLSRLDVSIRLHPGLIPSWPRLFISPLPEILLFRNLFVKCVGGFGIRRGQWGFFPGSPVVKTPHFHCRGHGFDLCLRNQDTTRHVAQPEYI